jgi:raffinose/stachyose/melibiose transport system substrate-binding protein
MKFNKMMVLIVPVVFLIVTVFTGCSKNSAGEASGAAQKAPEKAVLTLMFTTDNSREGIDAVTAAAKEKLNIDIEFETYPGGEEGNNLVRSRLATGDMTDLLFYSSGSLFKTMDPENYFYDLSKEPFVADYDEVYKSTVSVNGKTFGVPSTSSSAGGWLYNKTICDELGLKVPLTWKELMQNCERIRQSGRTAIIGSYATSWTCLLPFYADEYNLVTQVPGFVRDYTANKVKYAATPAALRGFEKILDVFQYFNKDYSAVTYDVALDMLAEGKGVYYPMLTTALSTIHALYGDKVNNIGVFAQPSDDPNINGLTVWMPMSIYLNKDSSNIGAALTWLNYYLSDEALDLYSGVIKPNGPYVLKGKKLPDDAYAAVFEMQKYFDQGHTAPAFEFETPVYGLGVSRMLMAVTSGDLTPKEAAAEHDKNLQKSAIQLGLEGW